MASPLLMAVTPLKSVVTATILPRIIAMLITLRSPIYGTLAALKMALYLVITLTS